MMKKDFWELVAKWRLTRAKKKGKKAIEEFVKFVQAYRKEDPENDSEIKEFAQEFAEYTVKISDAAWENPNIIHALQDSIPSISDYTKEDFINDVQDLCEILVKSFNEATGMDLEIIFKEKE